MKDIIIKHFNNKNETKYKRPIEDIIVFIICSALLTWLSFVELFKMIKTFWLK